MSEIIFRFCFIPFLCHRHIFASVVSVCGQWFWLSFPFQLVDLDFDSSYSSDFEQKITPTKKRTDFNCEWQPTLCIDANFLELHNYLLARTQIKRLSTIYWIFYDWIRAQKHNDTWKTARWCSCVVSDHSLQLKCHKRLDFDRQMWCYILLGSEIQMR